MLLGPRSSLAFDRTWPRFSTWLCTWPGLTVNWARMLGLDHAQRNGRSRLLLLGRNITTQSRNRAFCSPWTTMNPISTRLLTSPRCASNELRKCNHYGALCACRFPPESNFVFGMLLKLEGLYFSLKAPIWIACGTGNVRLCSSWSYLWQLWTSKTSHTQTLRQNVGSLETRVSGHFSWRIVEFAVLLAEEGEILAISLSSYCLNSSPVHSETLIYRSFALIFSIVWMFGFFHINISNSLAGTLHSRGNANNLSWGSTEWVLAVKERFLQKEA